MCVCVQQAGTDRAVWRGRRVKCGGVWSRVREGITFFMRPEATFEDGRNEATSAAAVAAAATALDDSVNLSKSF